METTVFIAIPHSNATPLLHRIESFKTFKDLKEFMHRKVRNAPENINALNLDLSTIEALTNDRARFDTWLYFNSQSQNHEYRIQKLDLSLNASKYDTI